MAYLYQYRGPSYERLSPSAPSLSAEQQKLLGVTPSSRYTGLYQIGDQNLYLSGNQVWQQDQSGNFYLQPLGTNTRFKRYSGDVRGFIGEGEDDARTYSPSMAYLSAIQAAQTPYVPFAAKPAPLNIQGYKPGVMSNIYTPATGNLLSAPVSTPSYSGNYGAGRFLNTGNLLGPTYGLQQQAGNYTSSYTPSSGYLTPPSVLFNRLNATNVPILNLFGTLGNAGALNNMSYTNSDTGFSGTVGEAQSVSV